MSYEGRSVSLEKYCRHKQFSFVLTSDSSLDVNHLRSHVSGLYGNVTLSSQTPVYIATLTTLVYQWLVEVPIGYDVAIEYFLISTNPFMLKVYYFSVRYTGEIW